MNLLSVLYNEVFHQPLFNALIFLTYLMPGRDAGLAIILLTVLVRFVLLPFTHRALSAQNKLKELEPEINKIKEETKAKADEQGRRIMELYKRHGVNPFSGCLIFLVQVPIFIALYRVFWKGISLGAGELYSWVPHPDFIQTSFLGLIDLSGQSWLFAVLAGVSQFLQMKLSFPSIPKGGPTMREEMSRAMAIQFVYVFPFVIFYVALRFPAALALYWTVTNLFDTVHKGFVAWKARKIYGERGGKNKNHN